jgi:hypothetical protein
VSVRWRAGSRRHLVAGRRRRAREGIKIDAFRAGGNRASLRTERMRPIINITVKFQTDSGSTCCVELPFVWFPCQVDQCICWRAFIFAYVRSQTHTVQARICDVQAYSRITIKFLWLHSLSLDGLACCQLTCWLCFGSSQWWEQS